MCIVERACQTPVQVFVQQDADQCACSRGVDSERFRKGVFEEAFSLLTTHTREPLEELLKRVPCLQVRYQTVHGNRVPVNTDTPPIISGSEWYIRLLTIAPTYINPCAT